MNCKHNGFLTNEVPSFWRRPESSYFNRFWTPAFAGVTFELLFINLSIQYFFTIFLIVTQSLWGRIVCSYVLKILGTRFHMVFSNCRVETHRYELVYICIIPFYKRQDDLTQSFL